jgi:transcription antitermination factor NusG
VAEYNWLVVELNDRGISAEQKEIEHAIREMLGDDAEFFIPIHREQMGSYISTSILFDGYIFVRDSPTVRDKLSDIHEYRYFSKVLSSQGKLQKVNTRAVGVLRRKLVYSTRKRLKPGIQVKIIDGVFKDMPGEVAGIEDKGSKVIVRVKTISREWMVPLPATSVLEI